ncbi:MAG TPA: hypothetical protein VFZ04_17530 [Longimicrobiales bacterium]
MRARFVVPVVALLAMAPALHAQNAGAQGKANAQARIEAALSAATNAGIPVELLQSKVAEGRAKGVSEVRIAAAVEARLKGLQRAAAVMQRTEVENASSADLTVAADALEAGVSENALIKLSNSAPAERRAVAIATLTGLVQLGHASDRALERVSAVVRSNAELGRLNADVASKLQRGVGKAGSRRNANAGANIRVR